MFNVFIVNGRDTRTMSINFHSKKIFLEGYIKGSFKNYVTENY